MFRRQPSRWRWLFCLLATTAALSATESEPANPIDWPREYSLQNGRTLVLYQPQFERWNQAGELRGTAAISYDGTPSGQPLLGTVILDASSATDLKSGLVRVDQITLLEGAFADLSIKDSKILTSRLVGQFPKSLLMTLDQAVVGVRRGGQGVAAPEAELPKVLLSQSPAVLLQFSGDPEWESITGLDLQVPANSEATLFFHGKKKTYYLLADGQWLQSKELGSGWATTAKLPKELRKIDEADEEWEAVVAMMPTGKTIETAETPTPRVLVYYEPAALVTTTGEPSFDPIPETNLEWATNADHDLFKESATGTFYLVVSDRWLQSESLVGPWSRPSSPLPGDFAKIPEGHEKASVRSWVPGTPEHLEMSVRKQRVHQENLSPSEQDPGLFGRAMAGENDLYAGLDGLVYRSTGDGWEMYFDNEWSVFQPPSEPKRDPSTGRIEWNKNTLEEANRRRVYNLLEWDRRSRARGKRLALSTSMLNHETPDN